MTDTSAVAYVATPGYLFQTMLSASQARRRIPHSAEVHVVALRREACDSRELDAAALAAQRSGVHMHIQPLDDIGGLHPMFGRFFLDRMLPGHISRILYLDGDTQVLGDLTPLLDRTLEPGHVAAVKDPMLAVRRCDAGFRQQIDDAWDRAAHSSQVRAGYVNTGVMMLSRSDFASVREAVLDQFAEHGPEFTFPDQDAVNAALWHMIEHIELEWNYPAFLLPVDIRPRREARIVHYMSNPRPWQGSYLPWGRPGHSPYRDFARENPELGHFWSRPGRMRAARNHAQQMYKYGVEGKVWRSQVFAASLRTLYPQSFSYFP